MSFNDSNNDNNVNNDNNNWTKLKECKLLEWQQQARLHSVGHGKAQENYTETNNRILLPSISMGALAVFLDGVALVWTTQHVPFIIAALLFTAIATILDGVLQTTKPSSIASSHEDMARGYNKIILQIDSMLTKEFDERVNGSQFLTKIEEELILLKTGGIKVPSNVWNKIKASFLKGDLDFQNIEKTTNPLFRSTIRKKIVRPSLSDTSNASTASGASVHTLDASGGGQNEVLPTFELKIDDDPISKQMGQAFFDFQMSRFGY